MFESQKNQYIICLKIIFHLQMNICVTGGKGEKWTLILTVLLLCAHSFSANEIELAPLMEFRMVTFLEIGTPPQKLLLLFDTGAPYTYIPSADCDSCSREHRSLTKFDQLKSSTFSLHSSSDYHSALFIAGKGTGLFVKDVVSFDGWSLTFDKIFLTLQEVVMQDRYIPDGIFGLSNSKQFKNIFQVAFDMGIIQSSIFGFRYGNILLQEESYFYYNISKSQVDDMFYVKAKNEEPWVIEGSGLKVGGIFFPLHQIILDTGSPFILIPGEIFSSLFQNFFSPYCNELFLCDCDYSLYPDLEVTIQGLSSTETFAIPPPFYMPSSEKMNFLGFSESQKKGKCIYTIQGMNPINQSLFGLQFFSGRKILFDKQNNQIGIGREPIQLQSPSTAEQNSQQAQQQQEQSESRQQIPVFVFYTLIGIIVLIFLVFLFRKRPEGKQQEQKISQTKVQSNSELDTSNCNEEQGDLQTK